VPWFSEWRSYRAFKRIPRGERRIVFLSESRQDWHHFAPVIRHLTGVLEEPVLYVSSDPGDPGLHQGNPRISGFCVGKGIWRISFCQFLDADVLVTQILDFGNLELKRSVHPVHVVYMFHSLISTHMADRANSFDNYDTILCAGPHQMREIRRREELHSLPAKQLVPHGYGRLEELLANRREPPPIAGDRDIHVLVAPSWGEQTILPVCGGALVATLLDAGFRVTLRPHYQTRWMTPAVIDDIALRHRDNPRFRLIEQMGESDSLYDSHVMITDWSGAGQDYGMGLEKPVLYIDVPPKARNDTWPELGMEPFESYVRRRLGALLPPGAIGEAPARIRELVADPARFRASVAALRADWVYNLGSSGPAGAAAIARIAADVRGSREP
jgi:YidC/Oxa1 family membrane protein insertase